MHVDTQMMQEDFLPLKLNVAEFCLGLPPDIKNLKTDSTFPVGFGTEVSVTCNGDRELRGSNVITCNQEEDFLFSEKPKCNDIGWIIF